MQAHSLLPGEARLQHAWASSMPLPPRPCWLCSHGPSAMSLRCGCWPLCPPMPSHHQLQAASTHAPRQLGWTLRWTDEIHAILRGAVDYHFLATQGTCQEHVCGLMNSSDTIADATFAEAFYSIKRTTGAYALSSQILSLECMHFFPCRSHSLTRRLRMLSLFFGVCVVSCCTSRVEDWSSVMLFSQGYLVT